MIGFVVADAFQVEGGQLLINSTAYRPFVPVAMKYMVRSIVFHDANCLVGCAIQEIWGNMGLQFVWFGVQSHGLQISWETSALKSAKIFSVRWFLYFLLFSLFYRVAIAPLPKADLNAKRQWN
jgi:hypothetical protein